MSFSVKNLIVILLVIAVLVFGAALGFYFLRGTPEEGGVNLPVVNVNAPITEEGGSGQAPTTLLDSDNDGLTDDQEKEIGTNPQYSDTDGDGLNDNLEVKLKHDPLTKDFNLGGTDSDNDGLTDDEENFLGTNSNSVDTDGDGISDLGEIATGTDPSQPDDFSAAKERRVLSDTDKDGLTDDIEKEFGTDPNKTDTDNDELNDYEEVNLFGTDPLNPDTDGDGYKDGEEAKNGYNPNGPGKL